ncbi:S8 family serine peptidase [Rhodococcus hoagii]|nr:S8 family serine peptidase [Prescottella equi]
MAGLIAAAPHRRRGSRAAPRRPGHDDPPVERQLLGNPPTGRSERRPEHIGYGNTQTMAMAIRQAVDTRRHGRQHFRSGVRSASDGIADQSLGAAVHYAATVKNAVVVAAAGNFRSGGCMAQNPGADPLDPGADPWDSGATIATPAWSTTTYSRSDPSTRTARHPNSLSVACGWTWRRPAPASSRSHPTAPARRAAGPTVKGKQMPFVGTSFAAPLVSATVALVRARYPQLTAQQVIARIEATAHAPAEGWNPFVGRGVVDPVAAVTADMPDDAATEPAFASAQLPAPQPPRPPDSRPARWRWPRPVGSSHSPSSACSRRCRSAVGASRHD